MSAFEKPQIIAHIQKGLNYTVFDCKWVPCSAKFVTMGNFARGTGVMQLYEIQHGDLKLLREVGARRHRPVPRCASAGVGPPCRHSLRPVVPLPKAPLELRGNGEADCRWSSTSAVKNALCI